MISIYVEGGGDGHQQKVELRHGFDALLKKWKDRANEKGVGWKLVCAGGRQAAYEAFVNAVTMNPGNVNILLVDAEDQVEAGKNFPAGDEGIRASHLRTHDGWSIESGLEKNIHLMVQTMEAWLIADPDGLAEYFKQGFQSRALSKRINLEDEPKNRLVVQLDAAAKETKKGRYQKIRDGAGALSTISAEKVAARCPRFRLFIQWLEETIENA